MRGFIIPEKANEFAATTARSPPSRTPSLGIGARRRGSLVDNPPRGAYPRGGDDSRPGPYRTSVLLVLSYDRALASDFLRPLNYVVHAAHLAEPADTPPPPPRPRPPPRRARPPPAVPRSRPARRTGGHGRRVGTLRRRVIRRR